MDAQEAGEGFLGPKGGEEEWVLHSPLHVAAYTGDLTKLQAILETGAVRKGRTKLWTYTLHFLLAF